MKRILSFILLLPVLLPCAAQFRDLPLDDSETVRAFREHVTFLSAAMLEGRAAGSEGEAEAARYVSAQLAAYDVDLLSPRDGDPFGIARESGDTLRSRNVIGWVRGYDRKLSDRYIVVGARLDNLGVNHLTIDGQPAEQIYYGANGNASGLAMMMELARMVRTNAVLFRRSVLFVAFGASSETYAGAWYFLNRTFDAGKIDAMINLDMVGAGQDGFCAYTSSNADLDQELQALTAELLPAVPKLTTTEPYPSDHRAFYALEIPSVFFSTGQYPEHGTDRDTGGIIDYEGMERELETVYAFAKRIADTDRPPVFHADKVRRTAADDKAFAYYDCDQYPTFMGHSDPKFFLDRWVYQYLRYPQAAVEQGIQGRVIVNFAVDTDGTVTDVEVSRGVHLLLDEEALRVVKASPKWKPGKVKGWKVKAYISIPVEFKLEKKSKGTTIGIKK